jgi:hypothetical protein
VEETEEDDQDHCWLLLEPPPPFSKTDAMLEGQAAGGVLE